MSSIIATTIASLLTGSFGGYAIIAGYVVALALAIVAFTFVVKPTKDAESCKTDKTVTAVTGSLAAVFFFVTSALSATMAR